MAASLIASGAEDGGLVVGADCAEAGAPDGHEDRGAGDGSAAERRVDHRDGRRRADERRGRESTVIPAIQMPMRPEGAEDGEGEVNGVVGRAGFADEWRDVGEERRVYQDQRRPADGHGLHARLGDGLAQGPDLAHGSWPCGWPIL